MWGLSRTKVVLLAAVVLIVAFGILSALIILGPHISVLNSTFAEASIRLQLYRNSLYLIRDYAFTGIGLGSTFAMVYSRYGLLIFVPFLSRGRRGDRHLSLESLCEHRADPGS